MKRLLCCLLTLLLAIPTLARAESPRKLTVMVYMCGSNLESGYGSASADLEEMLASGFDNEQVSLLVMTGGTEGWVLGFDPANLTINEIGRRGVRAVWREEAASMGVPETLTTLLNFGVERFPAEDYALILWNHGGGPMEGVCWDELFSMDNLSLSELTQALEASTLPGKLSWIGFDACLMSSAEVASTLAPYADYMIASQETEPAPGWNYAFLNGLESDADAAETGKRIVDAYFDGAEALGDGVTLACTDLSQVGALTEALDDFFGGIGEGLTQDSFAKFSALRMTTSGFGKAVRAAGEDGYDLVDLGDLIRSYGGEDSPAARALEQAVVYSRSSVKGASGLSVYHPYANKAKYEELWGDEYQSIDFSDGYRGYLNRFGALLTGAVMADWSGLEAAGDELTEEQENLFTLQLTPEQVSTFASAQLLVLGIPDTSADQFESFGVRESDRPLAALYAQPAQLDENGLLTAAYSGRTLYVTGADGQPQIGPISFMMADDGTFYATFAWYYDSSNRGNEETAVTVRFDFVLGEDGQPVVIGTRVWDEVTQSYTNRIPVDEYRYTYLRFRHLLRTEPQGVDTLPAYRDWPIYKGSYDQYITMPQDWQLRFFDEQLANLQLYGTFQVTDVQQNTVSSPLTPLKNPNVTSIPVILEPAEIGGCRLSVALRRSTAPIGSGLVLDLTVRNPTDEDFKLDFGKIALNGTRETDREWRVYQVPAHSTVSSVERIDAIQLCGLSEINEISCDLQWGRASVWDSYSADPEGTVTLRLQPKNCDVSGLAPRPDILAEAQDGDVKLWLLDLGYKRYLDYDFDGWLWVVNDSEEPFGLGYDCGVLFNGVHGQDACLSTDIPPHMDRLVRFGYANGHTTVLELANGDSDVVRTVDHLLQHAGVEAVSEVSLFLERFSPSKARIVTFDLEEPWPIPAAALRPEVTQYDVEGRLLLRGPVSATLESAFVGSEGLVLGMTLRNDTDDFVNLGFMAPRVNGEKARFYLNSNLLAPHSIQAVSLSLNYDELPASGQVEDFSFFFRNGNYNTAPAKITLAEPAPIDAENGIRLTGDSLTCTPVFF